MIPKYRMWNRITSKLYHVTGLYFDSKEVQYTDEFGILRFIKFENTILMQSTGLKDKNGKEIFEGDIVTDGDVTSDIKYHQTLGFYMIGEYGFSVPFGQGVDVEYFEEFADHVSKTFEVVGNVYENPELLEVAE
nr:MAG TPA: YopX protein [Caudoviricetes sp.]